MVLTPKENSDDQTLSKIKIGIVGCGKAATSIIDLLGHDPLVEIAFVLDSDPKAPGLKLAKSQKISILNNISEIKAHSVDVIFNLTGSVETGLKLKDEIPPDIELLGSKSAGLISSIMDERRKRLEERERVTSDRELFHSMGLHMEKIDNLRDAAFAIIEYGTSLGTMPAGAVSVYDDKEKEMVLLASNELEGFEEDMRWKVDDCAATKKVLSNYGYGPIAIDAFEQEQMPKNPFSKLEVRSIVAVPLVLKEKLYGIIYLCDYDERIFLKDELEILALVGVYSSLMIEKVNLLEKMRHLIVTDGLTGLANQRFFLEHLEKEFQRSSRYSHDLSIVMFDIDNFKAYTDEHGHLQGNEMLKHLSKLLNHSVRQTDTVARFGVEKFCVMLCEIGKEGAFTFAQRLVERIASYPMPNESITVSAGVSSYPRDAKDHQELIDKSEVNLKKAKEWGRNRACS